MTEPDGEVRRPNVLFVICDQLRADHLGFGGNQVVRTPNLDALAARGTVFDRAYVNNPICMPNRSTIMTGRLPSAHGVVFNDRSLPINVATFVGRLRDEGWSTALIGKSHLQHGLSRDAVHDRGYPGRWSPFAEGWDTVEHQERYEDTEAPAIDDFYGFGHVDLTIGHGATAGGHHYRWARELGVEHDVLRAGLDPTWPVAARSPHWWQVHPSPIPEEASSTSFVTERTIDFIRGSTEAATPWMVWCSFPDPHHPMAPPEPWFSRYDPDDIELPRTFDDPGEDWPEHLTFFRGLDADQRGRRPYVIPFGATPDVVRAATAATYGMIEAIDHGVGRIVAAIEDLGTTDDTIVIFTTDHGDMGGDHGLMLKGVMHFQGCLRTPLVIVDPGRAAQRTESLAASVDLPSTVLDLCGVEGFDGMQGTSLRPVLDDRRSVVRDAVLVEDDFPLADVRGGWPERTRTVVTDRHRFTRDANRFEMLYDLDSDPDELVNLAVPGRSPSTRTALLEALVDQMAAADDLSTVGRPTA
ncbi:MAG: sulfatase-like hydrolase/transferase [Actinomycetota bacterium]